MKFKNLFFALILIGAGALLAMNISNGDNSMNYSRPSDAQFPHEKKENDKIVIVSNVSYSDLKQAMEEFFNTYNQRRFQTTAELKKLSMNRFAITFPYDTHFNTFLYFVYSLHHPKHVMYTPDIVAYDVPMPNDPWTHADMARKVAMIYLPKGSDEKGVLYMTTSDNLGFKVGFAFKSQIEKLDRPVMAYQAPDVTLSELKAAPSEEIY